MTQKVNTSDILRKLRAGDYPAAWAIKLTEEAVSAAKRLRDANSVEAGSGLRLYLDGKGCDGFFYGVTFDEPSADDIHFPSSAGPILVDPDTFLFVFGSTIDWIDDERGQGFLVSNPNHTKYRGKFYKKTAWQALLLEKNKQGNMEPKSSTPAP